MRIAVVIRSLNMGGMQRTAVSLAESFAASGHESHLIYFSDKDRVFTPENNVHLHLFDLKKLSRLTLIGILIDLIARLLNGLLRHSYFLWNGLFFSWLFTLKLRRLEKQYGRFDAIIVRGQGTFETLWPIQDSRFYQITVSMFIPSGTRLKDFYFQRLYKGKNVICVSGAIKEKLLNLYEKTRTQPRRIDIIGNPLKIDTIRTMRNAYEPAITLPYILSVSRITPNKNIALLMDAYTLLRHEQKIEHDLVIVGTGHDLENLKRKAETNPYKSSIHFMGQITNPYSWMQHADLFVLSSKFEGLGMVLLEALACETKVVATKSHSGVLDIMRGELEEYLCEQNSASMANTIDKALHDGKVLDFNNLITPFTPKSIMDQFDRLLNSSHEVM